MATDVNFYQLGTRPLDAVLPRLLEKALAAGFRAVVRDGDPARLARLDTVLWTYDAASFLPHTVDGPYAAAQPVLLTAGDDVLNDADLLVVVDGVLPDDLARFRRTLYLFDGGDADALARARIDWKAVRAQAEVTPVYWREDADGRWEKAG